MPEKLWTLHPTNAWMVFKAQKLYESSKQITYKPSPPTKYRPQPQNYLTLHPKTPLDPRYRSVKYNKKQTTKKGTQVSWRSILFDLVCLTLIACFSPCFDFIWVFSCTMIWYDMISWVMWYDCFFCLFFENGLGNHMFAWSMNHCTMKQLLVIREVAHEETFVWPEGSQI